MTMMNSQKINPLIVVLLCLLPCLPLSGGADPDAALDEIIAAEHAMAKLFYEKGLREAYLTYMAEEAIAFRDGPCLARPRHEKQPPDLPILFAWEPELADVSRAGDLGYTFGPYHVYKNRSERDPVGKGHYLAFWRRKADHSWKSVVDVGTSHGPVSLAVDRIRRPAMPAAQGLLPNPPADAGKEKTGLMLLDRDFSDFARDRGTVEAYRKFAAEDFHFCREGEYPVIGKAAALETVKAMSGFMVWQPQNAVVAASGDLAYTYGTGELGRAPSAEGAAGRFSYIRIWNRDSAGNWVMFLDLSVPFPAQ